MKLTAEQAAAERREQVRAMTLEEHATRARAACRAAGLADCIHYAPRATARADALYAVANATEIRWTKSAVIGLLPDGRMVLTCDTASFFEPKEKA